MKKYQIILADPPWHIKKIKRKVRPNQKEMDYPTMSVKEIKELPLKDMSAENSVCFLWTIQKYLPLSFEVLKDWGFKYQRTITWDKKNGMCLFGFHHRTEFCLFGYKGKIEMYPKRKTIPTYWFEKSPKHSKKPKGFQKAIEVFGYPRIELFAREKTEGWDVWGNEVESDIDLAMLKEEK
jgi:N6-adenosine-specific RNA methylase IME4